MGVLRRPFLGAVGDEQGEAREHRDGGVAALERGGEDEGLERGAGLALAAQRAIEGRSMEFAAADRSRAGRPSGGSSATSAACEARAVARETPLDSALGHILQLGEEGGAHLPVGRMIAAEPRRETAVAGTPSRSRRGTALATASGWIRRGMPRLASSGSVMNSSRACARGRTRLRARAPSGFDHGRERRRRADQPRDESGFRERQVVCRLPEDVPRHVLDAVDARAQVDAVEIELEDLVLRELPLPSARPARLL